MRTIKAAPSRLLIALGVAWLAAAAPVRAEDGVLRVGIITDMSGQYADGNGTGR
jgi:branched-chain amino acid transport system substrate-binding protein